MSSNFQNVKIEEKCDSYKQGNWCLSVEFYSSKIGDTKTSEK